MLKRSDITLAMALLVAATGLSGCQSAGGRSVSLKNDEVSEKVQFGNGSVSPVGHTGQASENRIQPISTAVPEDRKPSSWSKLLSPFQGKKKHIPLPLSKPGPAQADLEFGIDEF